MCYRDSWQHHGPAFAAWPAIVFLVSLQFTARSILPQSSTTTSTSFPASYFSGAQHGVARIQATLRSVAALPPPASRSPRRQRIRRFSRPVRARVFLPLSLRYPPCASSFPSSSGFFFFFLFLVALYTSPQQGSRVRANVHSRVSAFTVVALPVLLRLSHCLLRTPIRHVPVARATCPSVLLSVTVVARRSRSSRAHGSTSHRGGTGLNTRGMREKREYLSRLRDHHGDREPPRRAR